MPTSTYIPLATVTLGSSASSVTFSSIPATYRDLVLVAAAKHQTSSSPDGILLRFNGDSGSYPFVFMATTADNLALSGSADINFAPIGRITSANFTPNFAQIMDYSATDKHKTLLAQGALNAGTGGQLSQVVFAARWANTSAVNSLAITTENGGGFAVGSVVSLYGIAS